MLHEFSVINMKNLISVQAKLRCLHDYHLRLLHNVLPAPSGVDIANTIKYFSQTFLSKFNLHDIFMKFFHIVQFELSVFYRIFCSRVKRCAKFTTSND